jgi:hypothetical protein
LCAYSVPVYPKSIFSSFSVAACCMEGRTWEYVSSVITIELCPSLSRTTFGFSPASNNSVAHLKIGPTNQGAEASKKVNARSMKTTTRNSAGLRPSDESTYRSIKSRRVYPTFPNDRWQSNISFSLSPGFCGWNFAGPSSF